VWVVQAVGLHGLHEVAAGLDPAEGLSPVGRGVRRRAGGALWRRSWLKALALLVPPVGAFMAVYVAALVALFVTAFWTTDSFTGQLVHHWTTTNFSQLWQSSVYRNTAIRTITIAAVVTLVDALIAIPFAYFMARLASPRLRAILFVLVLLPLWASFLARIYAWQLILNHDGLLNWSLRKIGLPAANLLYTNTAVGIVFSYIWLPFMILPVYAAFERIPHSYIEASRDLGGKGSRTFRSVILPLALPGVVAGSIFTFSLTLGDYITPTLVGGTSSQLIGNVVYENITQSQPLAAAFAVIPVIVMGVYLLIARRLGAFEAI
jgi:putative spermidine/putrescine transport system permease protein